MSTDTRELNLIVQTLVEHHLIDDLCEPIKSGKEATVFRCSGHPESDHRQLALKIYRDQQHRSFKNDALYREGSAIYRIGGGKTRAARALRAGTRFGKRVQEGTWSAHEWSTLELLYANGLRVPEPVYTTDGAILMELFACADGSVAPPLARARLSPHEAEALFAAVCDDVERMLGLHLIHGDLSPYNILWNGESYCIIDFPQAIDPRFNRSARQLLERDLANVGRFCARFGTIDDPGVVAAQMWSRFQLPCS